MTNLAADNDTRLRSIGLEDSAELFALVDANREHLGQWLGWVKDTRSESETREYITGVKANEIEGTAMVCCIEHKRKIVGVCGFIRIDKANKSAEIGYWLAKSAIGSGLMSRCVSVLLEYAFLRQRLHRVELRAALENKSSRALAERLGFSLEGVLRDAVLRGGKPQSMALYSLLKSEWDAATGEVEEEPVHDVKRALANGGDGMRVEEEKRLVGEEALAAELGASDPDAGQRVKFECPSCERRIFNRRLSTCEFCGEAIPAALLYSQEERDEMDAARAEKAERQRRVERELVELRRTTRRRGGLFGNPGMP